MTREEIEKYLRMVGQELDKRGLTGEIVIVGGAYMLLAIRNRETTKDVDAYFATEPAAIREAAEAVAQRERLPPDWLNDGVKGFFYQSPPTQRWIEFPGLRVYVVSTEYAFAMKAVAGRPEDIPDLRALIERLGLHSAEEALQIVQQFVPLRVLTPRTQYLIESLFEEDE